MTSRYKQVRVLVGEPSSSDPSGLTGFVEIPFGESELEETQQEHAACPQCGSVVLLELEQARAEYAAPLVKASGVVACDFTADDCKWLRARGRCQILGCAVCDAEFGTNEAASRVVSESEARAELFELVSEWVPIEPPAHSVAATGDIIKPIPNDTDGAVDCPHCGGRHWVLSVADARWYVGVRLTDGHWGYDRAAIAVAHFRWEILNCAKCEQPFS